MHTPVSVTERALVMVAEHRCDGVLAIGGGSTIGLGKAIALRTDFADRRTTINAGSEVTPVLGETQDGVKTTQRSPRILPEARDLRCRSDLVPAAQGLGDQRHERDRPRARGALCAGRKSGHFIDGRGRHPGPGPEPAAHRRGSSGPRRPSRGPVWGLALRKLAWVRWGWGCITRSATRWVAPSTCRMPTSTPWCCPTWRRSTPSRYPKPSARVSARALGTAEAGQGLYDLEGRLGPPRSLREIGMPADGIEHAVALITKAPYWNPATSRSGRRCAVSCSERTAVSHR